jgi:flagellar biosynthetic protein FliQ
MDSAELQLAVDLGREALMVALKLALPLLLVGLVVGVVISILQAATQVQEQTLTFVPKMFAVVGTLFILMPWFLTVLVEYTHELVRDMGTWFK